jgi:hypothetical protein
MATIFDKIEILFSKVMSGTRAQKTTKMSTEMPTTNVIDMPVEQVTEAIVAAAKRVRKPKAEITIVEQIVCDILAGKFAEEAATHLKQIFGDEFCIKRGLMEKPKKTRKPKAQKVVSEEPTVSEGEEKPKEKKARKPKAPKVVSEATEAIVSEGEEKPKEKKVRKPKAPKVVVEPISEAVVSEATVSEEKPKEKKVRKPKAPKVVEPVSEAVEATVSEATVSEPVVSDSEEKPKEKKARKPKAPKAEATVSEPVVSEATVSEPVVSEEKPKVKKVTKKPISPKETTSVAIEAVVTEEKPKVKKVTKKPASPKETPAVAVVEATATPVLETDEFSENWGKPLEDELIEEELSDIEEEM